MVLIFEVDFELYFVIVEVINNLCFVEFMKMIGYSVILCYVLMFGDSGKMFEDY